MDILDKKFQTQACVFLMNADVDHGPFVGLKTAHTQKTGQKVHKECFVGEERAVVIQLKHKVYLALIQ